ncbi:hypothetical protein DM558_06205 [Entomomonas moraniae]|uniref:Uncharacterized protein n=1 Tax=Entomomonas moraniae TaxID=2213226 RepID=A0A3S9XD85_9GAMM|nr:hypothetical protein [Entomomonas moraniae]AZS50392.1 hypothetical protein DM558_06205 [Entomomonas moraniae]
MPKIIISTLLVLLACSGLSMANECKIKEISPKEESNSYTFKNIVSKGLALYSPIPIGTIAASDGVVLILERENLIGIFTIQKDFITKGTIEKTIQEAYYYDCSEPIININKPDYKIYIIEQKGTLDDRPRTTAFVLTDKYKDLFYLISFTGFSKDEVVQMLTRK